MFVPTRIQMQLACGHKQRAYPTLLLQLIRLQIHGVRQLAAVIIQKQVYDESVTAIVHDVIH